MFFTREGMAIRFLLDNVARQRPDERRRARHQLDQRRRGRGHGPRALRRPTYFLVTSNGFGKKMPVSDFRSQGRGGQGVRAINLNEKTGPVADARTLLSPDEEIVLVSSDGQVIRCGLKDVRPLGRYAAGVIVMRMKDSVGLLRVARLADGRDGEPDTQPEAS